MDYLASDLASELAFESLIIKSRQLVRVANGKCRIGTVSTYGERDGDFEDKDMEERTFNSMSFSK